MRHGGAGPDAERERVDADRAERHRPRAGRRDPDDRSGLRPDADDLGPARASRWDCGETDQFPRADDAGRPGRAFRSSDHPAHQGDALHAHHEPDRPAVSGAAAQPPRARARHPHDVRRRARLCALPVQAGRSRVRLLRHESTQVAAGPARNWFPGTSARRTSSGRGRSRPRGSARTPTSGSSRRSARTWRARRRRSPRRWRSIR